jgi:hypothetical protein
MRATVSTPSDRTIDDDLSSALMDVSPIRYRASGYSSSTVRCRALADRTVPTAPTGQSGRPDRTVSTTGPRGDRSNRLGRPAADAAFHTTYTRGGRRRGMAEISTGSDKEVGFAVLFGLLGLVGALAMYVGAVSGSQLTAALGFAGAMLAASILVVAIHVYG